MAFSWGDGADDDDDDGGSIFYSSPTKTAIQVIPPLRLLTIYCALFLLNRFHNDSLVDSGMDVQVDGRRTVGPEAFAKIAPACPAMAHPITVRNLFDALTNSTGGRLHFLIYHKYLKSLDK